MFQAYTNQGGDSSNGVAIYSDGFNTVRVAGQPGNKAAEAAAAQTAFDTLYGAAPKRKRASALIAQAKALYNINDTLSEGFRTGGGTIAEYRALLLSVYTLINALPNAFATEFAAETAGLQLIANNATWTNAECQAWHVRIGQWLGRAMGAAALAVAAAQELD